MVYQNFTFKILCRYGTVSGWQFVSECRYLSKYVFLYKQEVYIQTYIHFFLFRVVAILIFHNNRSTLQCICLNPFLNIFVTILSCLFIFKIFSNVCLVFVLRNIQRIKFCLHLSCFFKTSFIIYDLLNKN